MGSFIVIMDNQTDYSILKYVSSFDSSDINSSNSDIENTQNSQLHSQG